MLAANSSSSALLQLDEMRFPDQERTVNLSIQIDQVKVKN